MWMLEAGGWEVWLERKWDCVVAVALIRSIEKHESVTFSRLQVLIPHSYSPNDKGWRECY